MSHRAQQIVDLLATLLRANANIPKVYTHRSLSLSAEEMELPCVSVTYGSDNPDPRHVRTIGSALDVLVICACVGDNESDVLTTLLELRRQSHIALMADSDLGLSFVINTLYGGAEAPQLQKLDQMTGSLTTRWQVLYEMNISDPE